ncbi:hypothetical protein PAHAL_2G499700 [Panicum hallii]|uniref:Uncharacterized protein n=1 Tax=Panicum hallii TaxID=206008 RepID=A0A2T8KTI6_9POAL|nr:hypothetical protein PAHAL_2G499700 [Panicum hallii]
MYLKPSNAFATLPARWILSTQSCTSVYQSLHKKRATASVLNYNLFYIYFLF